MHPSFSPFPAEHCHPLVWRKVRHSLVRCLVCDPPEPGETARIKGFPRGDGVVTPHEITNEIRRANLAAVAASIDIPGWSFTDQDLSASVPSPAWDTSPLVGTDRGRIESPDPPEEVLAVPGVGFWRDDDIVEHAQAEFRDWEAEQEAARQALKAERPTKKAGKSRKQLKPSQGSYDISE